MKRDGNGVIDKTYQKIKMHQFKAYMEVTLMVKRGLCPKLLFLKAGKTRILMMEL